jgi:hypothetical protein
MSARASSAFKFLAAKGTTFMTFFTEHKATAAKNDGSGKNEVDWMELQRGGTHMRKHFVVSVMARAPPVVQLLTWGRAVRKWVVEILGTI